jgi:hypothetical protein
MPVPWLQLIDAAMGVANFARGRKGPPQDDLAQQVQPGSAAATGIEARLAGVVVAALREAFDRDSHRLELEREQLAAERQRAERAMRLELQRHAVDREIGRLRLLAGLAVTAWFATLLLSTRLIAGGVAARVSLGVGWLFLLGATAASFVAQSHAAAAGDALALAAEPRAGGGETSAAGASALWLLLCGLVLVGVAALTSM